MIDPLAKFQRWLEAARIERWPEACCLCTQQLGYGGDGRMMLSKGVDSWGLRLFTQARSSKGRQVMFEARATAVFFWPTLGRQVRWRGVIYRMRPDDVIAYWRTRSRLSRAAAWVSQQSYPQKSRAEFVFRVLWLCANLGGRIDAPPSHWIGWHLVPHEIEFQEMRPGRMHIREFYYKGAGAWKLTHLDP